jgi:hypothetical protein
MLRHRFLVVREPSAAQVPHHKGWHCHVAVPLCTSSSRGTSMAGGASSQPGTQSRREVDDAVTGDLPCSYAALVVFVSSELSETVTIQHNHFEVPMLSTLRNHVRACVQVDADGHVLETSGACVGAESAAVDCNLKLLETFAVIRAQADSEDPHANSGLLNTFSRYHFSI